MRERLVIFDFPQGCLYVVCRVLFSFWYWSVGCFAVSFHCMIFLSYYVRFLKNVSSFFNAECFKYIYIYCAEGIVKSVLQVIVHIYMFGLIQYNIYFVQQMLDSAIMQIGQLNVSLLSAQWFQLTQIKQHVLITRIRKLSISQSIT